MIDARERPVLEQKKKLVNQGIVGKTVCKDLQARLPTVGILLPFFCSEDGGGWLQTERNGYRKGLTFDGDPVADP